MATYTLQKAPTTHFLKWNCGGCGFHNKTKLEGGDPMPEQLECLNCGWVIETPGWKYTFDKSLDDLTEIEINFQ